MPETPPGMVHPDSIEQHDASSEQTEKKKSRRPANTAFRQQRLKAWQPILTPKTVLPLFFTIGIIFAPIGGLLLWASSEVQELRINYTNCTAAAPTDTLGAIDADRVSTAFKGSNKQIQAKWRRFNDVNVTSDFGVEYSTDICQLEFVVPENMGPPVLFYYHLTNFYQNHRRYVESFFDRQLKGDSVTEGAVRGSKCDPMDIDNETQLPIYPCGLIANSMFNDTFTSPVRVNDGNTPKVYKMDNNTEIAWASDADLYGKTSLDPSTIVPPPNWRKQFPKWTAENLPDLKTWQAFQVWMRTAGLPEFSKLYQRNNLEPLVGGGVYQVNITDNFPTLQYKGTKSMVISTRTVMGGRNNFLGIAYVVVGGVCILLGVLFTVTHLLKPRKLGDHTYLSWNNVPGGKGGQAAGSSAVLASGRDSRPGDA